MRNCILPAALLLQGLCMNAQGLITVHSGEELSKYYTYLYPSFEETLVKQKNGTLSKARMNFNIFLAQMQFIDTNGDTLTLAKLADIDSIQLGGHVFYYDRGYFEILAVSGGSKLIVLRKINVDVITTGALGIRSHTVSAGNYDRHVTAVGVNKLVVNEDLSIQEEAIYSLVNKNGESYNASKSGFLKMFAANRKDVEDFIKKNKTNFSNEEDLRKLFAFCTLLKG